MRIATRTRVTLASMASMATTAIIAGAIACASGVGCATGAALGPDDDGGGTTVQSGDATADDGSDTSDGATTSGDGGISTCPPGRTGSGCTACATGFHACGNDCIAAAANVPEAGCSEGCGAACGDPQNGSASCSDAGGCDFVCKATFVPGDAGCACPAGQKACSNGSCATCCGDSDCPNHLACSNGACTGCVANWGDCDHQPGNGCEADLAHEPNCGSCGSSCCSSFCGCGFLGTGGKSCKANGASHSCQC